MILLFSISVLYLIIFAILLIIGLFIKIELPNRALNLILFFTIFSFSVLAFCTYPNIGSDLSRYYNELDAMRYFGSDYVFLKSVYKETFIANILFYLVSMTNLNGLLPAISTFISLSCFFYVLKKEIAIFRSNSKSVSLYIFSYISISFLRAILTGVRQHLAWSVLLFAVYFDFISIKQKRKSSILLYISSIFIHVGTLPVIIIRLFYMLTEKYKRSKYLILLWPLLITFTSDIVYSIGGILAYAYDKLLIYSEAEYPDLRLFIVQITFFLIIMFCGAYLNKKITRANNLKIKRYINFFLYVGLFGIASLNIHHLFSRIITFTTYLSFPIIIYFYREIDKKISPLFTLVFLILISGMIAYQFVDFTVSWRFVFK